MVGGDPLRTRSDTTRAEGRRPRARRPSFQRPLIASCGRARTRDISRLRNSATRVSGDATVPGMGLRRGLALGACTGRWFIDRHDGPDGLEVCSAPRAAALTCCGRRAGSVAGDVVARSAFAVRTADCVKTARRHASVITPPLQGNAS
jgi:hypothetical protein